MQSLKNISFIFGVLIMSLLVGYLAFAWTDAPNFPPSCSDNHPGCSAPFNVSVSAQAKQGPLVLAANSELSTGLIIKYGNVGIGTIDPKSKLDIAGAVQIGNDEEICNADKEGSIRYIPTSGKERLEGCNGTNWALLAPLNSCKGITSVTFLYKDEEITYGVVKSNDRCWLDRNLGASRVAEAFDDESAYGDLFQWGRLDDKHQDRNSTLTTTLSTKDVPGHSNFIKVTTDPYNWRKPPNEDLWQGVNGINNPCPSGWRIPTASEWTTEIDSWDFKNYIGAFESPLKLTVGGWRFYEGDLRSIGKMGFYWTSTVDPVWEGESKSFQLGKNEAWTPGYERARGFSVRCILDE